MAGSEWMIYGANGYTGTQIVERAVAEGKRPVLAGRRNEAVRPLAEKHGLEHRTFLLDDPRATARGLEGIGTLLLAAGPFSATSAPTIDACLKTSTHYVDITGEVDVFEAAQGRDADARSAGIVLLPGAGFDVVPSDCLAASLLASLPDTNPKDLKLQLAIAVDGAPGPGSLKTAIEGAEGGRVRRDGTLERVPVAWHRARIPFPDGPKWAMTIPWGDVSTAFWSTQIPDIEVYMATPRAAIRLARMSRPFVGLLMNDIVQRAVKRLVDLVISGGDATRREAGRSAVWGRIEDSSGRRVEGSVTTLETTTLTSHTAVDIVTRLQRGDVEPGYTTPSQAFGADYIVSFPGTRMTIGTAKAR